MRLAAAPTLQETQQTPLQGGSIVLEDQTGYRKLAIPFQHIRLQSSSDHSLGCSTCVLANAVPQEIWGYLFCQCIGVHYRPHRGLHARSLSVLCLLAFLLPSFPALKKVFFLAAPTTLASECSCFARMKWQFFVLLGPSPG